MSLAPSGLARPGAGSAERRQRQVTLACLLAGGALVASAAWAPAMLAVAHALRPSQLADIPRYRGDVQSAVDAARLRMQIVLLASVLAIVALAALAIVLGRKALRSTASAQTLARLERWAVASLVGGVAIWLVPDLLSATVGGLFTLAANVSTVLAALMLAGAVGSVILSGIALRRTRAASQPTMARPRGWRVGARVCLVVAPLVVLAEVAFVSIVALFIVAFYLRGFF